ncbi:hypothetical protein HaLaN_26654 [Haematococcus lacustris]|uniref:Uncharacterized protein n=1 Tax=Haematococcus lacustris TaxID=44745 RepID=A0A6A0A6V3_HAELA|nr:hypothetical protein HaLaN_26654 [Haematococcus lacustris]
MELPTNSSDTRPHTSLSAAAGRHTTKQGHTLPAASPPKSPFRVAIRLAADWNEHLAVSDGHLDGLGPAGTAFNVCSPGVQVQAGNEADACCRVCVGPYPGTGHCVCMCVVGHLTLPQTPSSLEPPALTSTRALCSHPSAPSCQSQAPCKVRGCCSMAGGRCGCGGAPVGQEQLRTTLHRAALHSQHTHTTRCKGLADRPGARDRGREASGTLMVCNSGILL